MGNARRNNFWAVLINIKNHQFEFEKQHWEHHQIFSGYECCVYRSVDWVEERSRRGLLEKERKFWFQTNRMDFCQSSEICDQSRSQRLRINCEHYRPEETKDWGGHSQIIHKNVWKIGTFPISKLTLNQKTNISEWDPLSRSCRKQKFISEDPSSTGFKSIWWSSLKVRQISIIAEIESERFGKFSFLRWSRWEMAKR